MENEDKINLRKLNHKYDVAYSEFSTSEDFYKYTVKQLAIIEINIDALNLYMEAAKLNYERDKARYLAIWQDIVNLSAKIDTDKKNKKSS